MKYKLFTKENNGIHIVYIGYENGKIIELARDEKYNLIIDNKYIFILLNNDLDKVFDINNKKFITKSFEMKLLYNKYKDNVRKQKNKKILKRH